MDIADYKWESTETIEKSLLEIEVLKKVFATIPPSPEAAKMLLRKSILHSAVSSARIEDIPSTAENPRKEGDNLIKAYTQIYSSARLAPLTVEAVKELHTMVLADLSGNAGQYRIEQWGIFNQAGIEIHHAPLHTLVPGLVQDLVNFINQPTEAHPCVTAAVAQFIFEKIHPFADGNGRAGRLITAYLLHRSDFGFGGLISLEKYVEDNRSLYYHALEPSHNCTEFIEFILGAVVAQANATLESFKNTKTVSIEDTLAPRRREILGIIRDHPECSFDFIYRRFIATEKSMAIHRDIAFLQQAGLIRKLGKTKGALYVANADIL